MKLDFMEPRVVEKGVSHRLCHQRGLKLAMNDTFTYAIHLDLVKRISTVGDASQA